MTTLLKIKERVDKFICREYASKEGLNKAKAKELNLIQNRKTEIQKQIEQLKKELGDLESLEYQVKWY